MSDDTAVLRRAFRAIPACRVGTVRPDGGPHVAVRWFVWLEDAVWVSTRIGDTTWEHSMRTLRHGGRMCVCGGTSGPKVELNLPRLFFKQLDIIGASCGSQEEFDFVTDLMADGLPVVIDEILPLSEYPRALERLRTGDQLGKIVLEHY